MQIPYERALQIFNDIEGKDKCPSLHPSYLLIDAKREASLEPIYFLYEEDGQIYYHAFHIASVPNTPFYDIQSPYGYGGPLSSTSDDSFLKRAWNSYRSWCISKKILAEFIRFHPILDNSINYKGEVINDRETVWINLQTENLLTQYQTRARRKIRKAEENGLRIEWCSFEEFYSCFPMLYEELLNELDAEQFYHFPKKYYQEWKTFDKVHFAICKRDTEVLAAAIFYRTEFMMEYHLSASNRHGKELAATSLLLHRAAELGKQLGCKQLHLGGGTDNTPDNTLFFFKSGFSKERGLFKIGKYIHLPDAYEQLKQQWEKENVTGTRRILFYR
ncbi:GNAT family N-acetyltransferase [Brevibacillus reuszeri]|uniref:GNAT family N-acetyltransferase n=1 Tax=Brevibacillus reuszeri TaxID=54915 RepID=UPI003D215EC9